MKRIAGLLVFAAAVIASQPVEAKNPVLSKVKTTFTPTNVDTNQDGLNAAVNGGLGTVKTGPLAGTTFAVGTFSEYQPVVPPDSFPCPQSTTTELSPVTGRSVSRLSNGASVLSDVDSDSSRICFDQNTFTSFFQVTDKITGGTGAFTGANGLILTVGTAVYDSATCDNNGNCSGKTNQTSFTELCLPPTTFCGGPGGTFSSTYKCCHQGQTCTEDTNTPVCN